MIIHSTVAGETGVPSIPPLTCTLSWPLRTVSILSGKTESLSTFYHLIFTASRIRSGQIHLLSVRLAFPLDYFSMRSACLPDSTPIPVRFVSFLMDRKFKVVELFGTNGYVSVCLADRIDDTLLGFIGKKRAIISAVYSPFVVAYLTSKEKPALKRASMAQCWDDRSVMCGWYDERKLAMLIGKK